MGFRDARFWDSGFSILACRDWAGFRDAARVETFTRLLKQKAQCLDIYGPGLQVQVYTLQMPNAQLWNSHLLLPFKKIIQEADHAKHDARFHISICSNGHTCIVSTTPCNCP